MTMTKIPSLIIRFRLLLIEQKGQSIVPEKIFWMKNRPLFTSERRDEVLIAVRGIVLDDVDDFLWVIGNPVEPEIGLGDGLVLRDQVLSDKAVKFIPEVTSKQDDRRFGGLLVPHHREDFQELVDGPDAAREEDIRFGREVHRDLAVEEVIEIHSVGDEGFQL